MTGAASAPGTRGTLRAYSWSSCPARRPVSSSTIVLLPAGLVELAAHLGERGPSDDRRRPGFRACLHAPGQGRAHQCRACRRLTRPRRPTGLRSSRSMAGSWSSHQPRRRAEPRHSRGRGRRVGRCARAGRWTRSARLPSTPPGPPCCAVCTAPMTPSRLRESGLARPDRRRAGLPHRPSPTTVTPGG